VVARRVPPRPIMRHDLGHANRTTSARRSRSAGAYT
jgi:hypothetical protein